MRNFLLIILLSSVIILSGCIELTSDDPPAATIKDGLSVYYDTQPRYYGADADITVHLLNNSSARNPTWQEVIEFLRLDETDENAYLPGIRVCAEFAAELHDNAEKAGIKAAWVSVVFTDNPEGHALNAFETTDKGLVFIDCTGDALRQSASFTNLSTEGPDNELSDSDVYDKIAYVEIGKEFGLISISNASSPKYSFYINYLADRNRVETRLEANNSAAEQYNTRVAIFNTDTEEYELLLGGRTVISDPTEYEMLTNMYDQLEVRRLELEQELLTLKQEDSYLEREFDRMGRYRWLPLGTVRSVEIYW